MKVVKGSRVYYVKRNGHWLPAVVKTARRSGVHTVVNMHGAPVDVEAARLRPRNNLVTSNRR